MRSNTELLWRSLDDNDEQRPTMPKSFIYGLRACLEAGMSCEQITAMLLVVGGVYEITFELAGDELVRRTAEVLRVMKGLREIERQ